MDIHCPISAPVRRHPEQYPCASSAQTLIQGEGGRSCGSDERHCRIHDVLPSAAAPDVSQSVAALNYGGVWPILQTAPLQRKQELGPGLPDLSIPDRDIQGDSYESAEQSSPLSDSRHRARRAPRFGDWRHAFQPARPRPLVPHCLGRVLDRAAVLLQRRPDPRHGGRRGRQGRPGRRRASTSTSPRAPSSGFAGRRWPPGSAAPGCSDRSSSAPLRLAPASTIRRTTT